jgi:rhamnose transport system permease protein
MINKRYILFRSSSFWIPFRRIIQQLRQFLPELVVTVLLVLAFIVSSMLSPYFLDQQYLYKEALLYMEIGILALGATLIIISGNLDLSIAGNLAMVAGVTAFLHAKVGIPMEISLFLGLLLGAVGGAVNGFFVAFIGLPSLAVTLATMALYRGVAQILLGDYSIQAFPGWFLGIDRNLFPGTTIPMPIIIFLGLAVVLGLILHKTIWGRWIYAIGTNQKAAHFSAVPIKWLKMGIFTLSGLLAGIAGLMLDSRLLVARYDHARGWELDAITAVVLGGTSIAGGRGTIYGTVVALFLIGVLRSGMSVANVKVESQLAVIGALLVGAVIISNILIPRAKNRVVRKEANNPIN